MVTLTFFDGEVTDYMVSFSGNSIAPAFSHGLPNLLGFVYVLGNPIGTFHGVDGIASRDGTTFYGTSTSSLYLLPPIVAGGKVGRFASTLRDTTEEFVTVTPKAVPEPFTILGAGTALGFGAFFKRKLVEQGLGKP